MADDADQIITLDSGERVRVTPEGERYLIPGPSPLMEQVAAEAEERRKQQQQIELAQQQAVERKQASLDSEPGVPPEKRIF